MKLELANFELDGPTELLAVLSTYYAQLERRLETAASPRDPQVRSGIARAAFSLVLASCPTTVATQLEQHREEIVSALLAHQIALAETVRTVAARLPRTRFNGPINTAFSALRRLTTKLLASPGAVMKYVEEVRGQVHAETPIIEVGKLTWADLANQNTTLYGTPDTHPLIRDVLAESGWDINANYIAIGSRKFEGEHLVMIACRSRPSDPTLSDVIYTGANEEDVVGINFLHHGPSDFVIGRRTKPLRYQILSRGNFARGPEGETLTTLL